MGIADKISQKISSYLFRYTPYGGIVVILGLWAGLASPYFFHHLVPIPTRQLVTSFAPWDSDPSYASPVKNNAMPDILSQIYPWKYFTIDQLKRGEFPLWNPYTFSGSPLLANYQSAVFSPFNLLYFILPFVDAWSITILIQPLIAGLSMYWLLRSFTISQRGSTVGSISFMFCGFITVWLEYGTLAMAISVLPLAIFSVEKYFRYGQLRWLGVLTFAILFSLFAGHFQTSLYLLIVTAGFIFFKAVTERAWTKGIISFIAVCLGGILALPQLLPTLQYYSLAIRSSDTNFGQGIPFYYLVTSFAPDFFGNPITRNDWLGFYAERASFIGMVPFLLALFSLSNVKRKEIFFFLLTAVVSLLFALDTPLLILLSHSHIPVLSTSNPTRIIVLWSFSLCVLSAFGFDILQKSVRKNEKRKLFSFIVFSLLLITVVWIITYVAHLLPIDKRGVAIHNLLLPSVILGSFAVAVICGLISKSVEKYYLFSFILITLVTFDSLRFATKWLPFDSPQFLYPRIPAITALQKLTGDERVLATFGGGVNTYFSLQSIEGYDPLYIADYGEFIKAVTSASYTKLDRSFVSVDRHAEQTDKLLDFLSVAYVFHPRSHTYQNWAYPVWDRPDRYELVYEDPLYQIYQNKDALSRARVYFSYEVLPHKKQLDRFYQEAFPYSQTLLLTKNVAMPPQSKDASGSAKIVSFEPNKVIIDTQTNAPGLLFTPDAYYPHWKATVNGKPTQVLEADYAFRAVVVPKGKSTVIFSYSYF